MTGLQLMGDWQWYPLQKCWGIRCRLTTDVPGSNLVPRTTEWFMTATDRYPWGTVKFYPALRHGLTATFQHQTYNAERKDWPWRYGDPCLNTTVHVLGRHGADREPFDGSGPRSRLAWHARRAIAWLTLAAQNLLAQAGDPFEVPSFYGTGLQDEMVAFAEDSQSFQQWQGISAMSGIIELSVARENPLVMVIRNFLSHDQQELLALTWGPALYDPRRATKLGIWLRFPRVPVLAPWQTPFTWGDFRRVCQDQGIAFDTILRTFADVVSQGDTYLLVGFPFPSVVGGPDEQMHWQAVRLQPNACDELTGSYPGFRPGKKDAKWLEIRKKLTYERDRIMWRESQNWASKELSSRGQLPAQLTERKVLLIGGGALGSVIAELLLRAGVYHITLIDGQDLHAGNLCRHTLSIADLEKNKAEGLANRLRAACPHAVVEAIATAFPPTKPEDIAKVQECDLIIDCTAEDDVLHAMSVFPWNSDKVFVSLSLAFAAKRLFCFVDERTRFPLQRFRDLIAPWLRQDEAERGTEELPREGIGCWHPVFPARADDVWMLGSIAVKQLASALEASFVTTGLTVFEQIVENNSFVGVRRVSGEAHNGRANLLVENANVRAHDTGESDRGDGAQVQGRQAQ